MYQAPHDSFEKDINHVFTGTFAVLLTSGLMALVGVLYVEPIGLGAGVGIVGGWAGFAAFYQIVKKVAGFKRTRLSTKATLGFLVTLSISLVAAGIAWALDGQLGAGLVALLVGTVVAGFPIYWVRSAIKHSKKPQAKLDQIGRAGDAMVEFVGEGLGAFFSGW